MIAKSGFARSVLGALGARPTPLALACLAGLCALVLGLEAGGEPLRVALRLERQAVVDGELWRLISGHVVHLGWRHALLNLAGVLLVAALFGPQLRVRQWLIVALASAAAIDAGLLLVERIGWYVGLSGVLHGGFAAGVVAGLRRRQRDVWLLGGFLLAKLIFEQWVGPLPLTERSAGGPVLVDSHLYGAIGGAVVGALLRPAGHRAPAAD